ncbi:bifunctional precorrin-2 dehydrogenase/sirohydrochlorin ferrochelatase [Gemmatimonadota bacterium]
MKYLPIGLDLRNRKCVVVGGGRIGTRKVLNLIQAGASVTLVSPEISKEMAPMAEAAELEWIQEEYRPEHLHGVFLAVAATDDEGLNAHLVRDARVRGVLVCDASSAERSQVIFGALHAEDDVTVAVFTDGKDPSRARKARDRIARLLSEDR